MTTPTPRQPDEAQVEAVAQGAVKPTMVVPLPAPTPPAPRTVTVRRLIGTHGQPDLLEAECSDGTFEKVEVWPEEQTP